MIADPSQTSLSLTRVYAAPPERIFRAWTDPAEIMIWMGPGEHRTAEVEMDLRVGGRYRYGIQPPDGGEVFYLSGTYVEVDPPRKLVYTWQWEWQGEDAAETLVTVEFRDREGETELVLTHERFPDRAERDRHVEGWCSVLDRLPGYLG